MPQEQDHSTQHRLGWEIYEKTQPIRQSLKVALTRAAEFVLSVPLEVAIFPTRIARTKVIGAENLSSLEAPYICALNHSSLYLKDIQIPPIDVLVVFRTVREKTGKDVMFIGRTDVPGSPFSDRLTDSFMWALYSIISKTIPVNTEKRFRSTRRAALKKLNEGKIILICPEGASQREFNRNSKYHPGTVYLALIANVLIIPIAVRNAYSIKDAIDGKIEIVIGEPINPREVAKEIVIAALREKGQEIPTEIDIGKLKGKELRRIIKEITERLQKEVNALYFGEAEKQEP